MNASAPGADGPILVIGFGNTLRRDDAVGPLAAEAVAGWCLPGVEALAVHQLLPEHAEPLSRARLAVFVDAAVAGADAAVRVDPIEPSAADAPLGHSCDPRRLLAFSRDAFGSCPPAWLLTVPASDLTLGEGPSPAASAGLEVALRRLAGLLADAARPTDDHPVICP